MTVFAASHSLQTPFFVVRHCARLAFVCVNWSSNSDDYITSQSTEKGPLFAHHCDKCLQCVDIMRLVPSFSAAAVW